MAFFPFFIDIAEKKVLVVGGGMVAFRKVEQLIPFGCHITVVSPKLCSQMEQIKGKITWVNRPFSLGDLEDMFFVISATDNETLNSEIANCCKENNILVNVVDVKEECTFFFPSLYKNGPICAGITTGGQSPQVAKLVRKKITEQIPSYYGDVANRLGNLRNEIKDTYETQEERSLVLKKLLETLLETENTVSDATLEQIWKGSQP